ncbi:MAG: hypothetical protein R2713_00955 [Ilumatobacteraceae bacterium]
MCATWRAHRSAVPRASSLDEAGTYTIFVETEGEIGELRGDCPNADTDYSFDDDELPDVDVELRDEDDDEVDLDDDESKDYDAGGFVGRSIATVEIEEAGDYELTATSDEDEIAIAVGRDPKGDSGSLKTMGIVAIVGGLVVGGLLLVLGLRRSSPPGPATPAAPGTPGAPGAPYSGPAYAPPAASIPSPPSPPVQPPTTYPAPPTMPSPPTPGPTPPAGPPAGLASAPVGLIRGGASR